MNGDARRKIAVKVIFLFHDRGAVKKAFNPEDFA
jgi:hypothetical protein